MTNTNGTAGIKNVGLSEHFKRMGIEDARVIDMPFPAGWCWIERFEEVDEVGEVYTVREVRRLGCWAALEFDYDDSGVPRNWDRIGLVPDDKGGHVPAPIMEGFVGYVHDSIAKSGERLPS